jgi:hypothetical protein
MQITRLVTAAAGALLAGLCAVVLLMLFREARHARSNRSHPTEVLARVPAASTPDLAAR